MKAILERAQSRNDNKDDKIGCDARVGHGESVGLLPLRADLELGKLVMEVESSSPIHYSDSCWNVVVTGGVGAVSGSCGACCCIKWIDVPA